MADLIFETVFEIISGITGAIQIFDFVRKVRIWSKEKRKTNKAT